MPTISPSLVPTIAAGNLFTSFTTDTSINIRFFTSLDPVYFEVLNRPIADVALRQLILAKSLDQLTLRLGHQSLFPFLIQPKVVSGTSQVDVPISMIWDMHVSLNRQFERVRLARIKRVMGTNSGSDPQYTGVLRLVFSAEVGSGNEEFVFQADMVIDSDLLYQIVRIEVPTGPESVDVSTGDASTMDGFMIFRTLNQSDSIHTAFLNAVAPPVSSSIDSNGEFDPPAVYEIANSIAGGEDVTEDFDTSVVSRGTGLLVVSAWNAIPDFACTETDPVYLSQKGAPNGAATLDGSGKVPASQLGNVPSVETDPIYSSQKGAPNGAATLDGSSNVPASQLGNVPLTNVPSTGEKQALVGTFGTPSSSNKYVTELDPRVTTSENYLLNPGFEVWTYNTSYSSPVSGRAILFPWEVSVTSAPTFTISRETTVANVKSGEASSKIDVTAGVGSGLVSLRQVINLNAAEYRGKSFAFSAEIKTTSGSKARLEIADSTGSTFSSFHTGGGAFEKLSAVRTIDSSATTLLVAINVDATAAVTVYADEALLVPATSAGTYRPPSPIELDLQRVGIFQCRMGIASSPNTTLILNPYIGNQIEVRNELVTVPSAGFSVTTSDFLLNASGGDSGIAPSASQFLYAYVSNSRASFAPKSLRLSLTSPASDVNSIAYLGISGNAANWRFVGYIFLNSSTQFQNDEANRFIANYYNRLAVHCNVTPGYVNDNAVTTYTTTSATYVQANGGVGSRIAYVSNGEDAIQYTLTAIYHGVTAGHSVHYGVGEDSTTSPAIAGREHINDNLTDEVGSVTRTFTPIVGLHTFDVLIASPGGSTMTFKADTDRLGASADPRGTTLTAIMKL